MHRTILALAALGIWLGSVALGAGLESARTRLAEAARVVQEETARHPFPFQDIGVFDVSSPDTIAGAGFLVEAEGKTYAVTAKHPHPTVLPRQFERGAESIRLGELVRDADDILCFGVSEAKLAKFRLIRPDGLYLKKGDAVTVVCHDKARAGSLNRIGLGSDEMLLPGEPVTENIGFTVPGEDDYNGNSGAPVILNKTGEVLGVLLKAVGVGRETMLEFAPLSFRAPFAPKPLRASSAVFGLVPRATARGLTESNTAGVFPPELL